MAFGREPVIATPLLRGEDLVEGKAAESRFAVRKLLPRTQFFPSEEGTGDFDLRPHLQPDRNFEQIEWHGQERFANIATTVTIPSNTAVQANFIIRLLRICFASKWTIAAATLLSRLRRLSTSA